MLTLRPKQAGFTIVELLIVIVVIAILAAISVVAYSGVTTRAHNAKIISAARNWKNLIDAYDAADGSPIRDGVGDVTCLGAVSDYPATADFAEGICVGSWGRAEDLVNTALSATGTVNQKWTDTSPEDNFWGEPTRGITFGRYGTTGDIVYTLKGDVACGLPEAKKESYASASKRVTSCTMLVKLHLY